MKKRTAIFLFIILTAAPASAEDIPSINENGQVGGLHLPTARTLDAGTAYIGAGFGRFDEYAFTGLQPLEDLRLDIRQVKDKYTLTYPGIDSQIQLLDESDWLPETALGFTEMVGQPRYGGEYLAFNKRYGALDFGTGLGWGRYAANGMFGNPFHLHDNLRDIGYGSEGPYAWFRGSRMGLFGSVTYQTPWPRLQLVAEYDRDPYFQERFEQKLLGDDFVSRRAPMNIGAHLTLIDGLALSGSFDSLSQFQLYLTYALNFQKENPNTWRMGYEDRLRPAPISDNNPPYANLPQVQRLAWQDGAALEKLDAPEPGTISARYVTDDAAPYGTALGHAAYAVADNTNTDVVAITLVPDHDGLLGDTYTLLRRDVVRDTQFKGSATEIRAAATITPTAVDPAPDITIPDHPKFYLYTIQRIDLDPYEVGSFVLSRERLQLGASYEALHGVTVGGTGDFWMGDNFVYIPPTQRPVRSDINQYMSRDVAFENLYVNEMQTIAPGLHTRVTAGLLEEMYRGASGEVLYQPFASRWAVGAEGDWLQQRDPDNDFGKLAYETTPWAFSVYYEILPRDLTIIARVQQFLAEDKGVTVELQHEFLRGAKLGFAFDWSNEKDFGGIEYIGHAAARMMLHIPLEYSVTGIPAQNHLDVNVSPLARDSGQEVELPVRLWDATRPISYGPISSSWDDFLNF